VGNKERAGRPKLVEDAESVALLDENPYQTQAELKSVGIVQSISFYAFKSIGNDSKARKLNTV